MTNDLFKATDPFSLTKDWLVDAQQAELNDANAIALSTVDANGLPNARMVLLKDIDPDGFIFYTNYGSVKAQELDQAGKAAFVIHWKSIRRQIRARGKIVRVEGEKADAYFESRSSSSRLGAWASEQSQPLDSRQTLMDKVSKIRQQLGDDPKRPEFWGGFKLIPDEMEFWADGAHRLHDRFRWTRKKGGWDIQRLYP